MRIEVNFPPIDGVRLFMLTPEQVGEAYVEWLNDPRVNRYLESRFVQHTVETTRDFVSAMVESPNNLLLGIRSEAMGSHVGNIKIGPLNDHHATGEIGILVGEPRVWGKGVASAAIRMICDIARDRLALRKVTAGCYASNVGSKRAFEKAGFEIEGIRKAQVLCDGVPEDLVLLGRLLR